MKRGLKPRSPDALECVIAFGPKTCPDEEGIETIRARYWPSSRMLSPKTCPDEEGIETLPYWLEVASAVVRETCPDEEGIETPHQPLLFGLPSRSE